MPQFKPDNISMTLFVQIMCCWYWLKIPILVPISWLVIYNSKYILKLYIIGQISKEKKYFYTIDFNFRKNLFPFDILWLQRLSLCSIIRVKSFASCWSGQNEDICPSIKKSMAKHCRIYKKSFTLWGSMWRLASFIQVGMWVKLSRLHTSYTNKQPTEFLKNKTYDYSLLNWFILKSVAGLKNWSSKNWGGGSPPLATGLTCMHNKSRYISTSSYIQTSQGQVILEI